MASIYSPVTIDTSISGSTNPDTVLWGGQLFVLLKGLEVRMEADSGGSWAAQATALTALGVPVTAAQIVAVEKVEILHTAIPIVFALWMAWPAIVN